MVTVEFLTIGIFEPATVPPQEFVYQNHLALVPKLPSLLIFKVAGDPEHIVAGKIVAFPGENDKLFT